jgi:sugar-specific transcriptional regulator TrmB
MNDQLLISHVEELGLSNKEARVYLASLGLGPASVQKIADEAGIKRVTTYVILESLVGLGLVSQTVKGKKTYFVAEDPVNLERLIERRRQELKEQKQNFDHILPELQNLKMQPKDSPLSSMTAPTVSRLFSIVFSSTLRARKSSGCMGSVTWISS